MTRNRTKARLAAGKLVVGGQLRFGSPAVAELFGLAGFDFVVFDSEHAPQTPVGIQAQIQALSSTTATPVVRLPKNDPDLMRPYLDMGAQALLVPFVCSSDEAALGARAMRYPPMGTRGYGPSRASQYGLDTAYFREANAEMLYLPIIEDERAVRNIDALLGVEGVDSFVIGPVDLSISLQTPMQFDHPRFRDAVATILKAGQAARKPLGTAIYGGDMFSADTYKRFADQGYTLLLIGGDEWMLQASCRKVMECVEPIRG